MTTTAVMEPAVIGAPLIDAKTEIALVDLSSIAHPLWHMSGDKPDVDWTSQQIVERIRNLTVNHPQAAVCCDSGRSFRNDLNTTYKANRPEREAALHHQIAIACERLKAEGYPVWSVRGFEADDLIATAATIALGMADVSVLILSADKDLLQLVGPRIRTLNTNNGHVYDEAAVREKCGVRPDQMRDFLTLVGDSSDNVKGAAGIGPKKAADLLKQFDTLDNVYANLRTHGTLFKPAMATSLREFEPRMEETRALIALRTDVEIPFIEIDAPRTVKDAPMEVDEMPATQENPPAVVEAAPMPPTVAQAAVVPQDIPPAPTAARENAVGMMAGAALVPVSPTPAAQDVLAPAPAEFEKQLEPRSLPQAMSLANHMYNARMFNGYGSPQAVLSTVMAGRELGLQAIASLRGFHIVEGRHALAADLIRGLVLRSGLADYFKCTERSEKGATFKTHRKDDPDPDPTILTYTIEDGRRAFGFTDDMNEKDRAAKEAKWQASGWGKNPADMCVARAGAKLARLVYPEVSFGLYAPEELTDNGR